MRYNVKIKQNCITLKCKNWIINYQFKNQNNQKLVAKINRRMVWKYLFSYKDFCVMNKENYNHISKEISPTRLNSSNGSQLLYRLNHYYSIINNVDLTILIVVQKKLTCILLDI